MSPTSGWVSGAGLLMLLSGMAGGQSPSHEPRKPVLELWRIFNAQCENDDACDPVVAADEVNCALSGLGSSLVGLGDVDGDGADDLAFGAPLLELEGAPGLRDRGAVRVVSGRAGSTAYVKYGDSFGGAFGSSIAAADDLDGDLRPDLLVGAPVASMKGCNFQEGRVFGLRGLDGALLFALDGASDGDRFGAAVASLGDLDGDGIDEFAVGAPGVDGPGLDAGRVSVFAGLGGQELKQFGGSLPSAGFGSVLHRAGDLDGDGFDDLAIGASGDSTAGPDQGALYVTSSRTLTLMAVAYGVNASERFGSAVSSVADIDGDGVRELVVGAPLAFAGRGRVVLLSGRTGSELEEFLGSEIHSWYGASVAGLPDLDGDGLDDLALGAPRAGSGSFANRGRVELRSSVTQKLLQSMTGSNPGDLYGAALAFGGDCDGDGLARELVIGIPLAERHSPPGSACPVFTDAGEVRVVRL